MRTWLFGSIATVAVTLSAAALAQTGSTDTSTGGTPGPSSKTGSSGTTYRSDGSAGTQAPNTGPSTGGAPGVSSPGTSSSGSTGATQGSGAGRETTGMGTTGAGVDVPRRRPGETSR
jgi:hypothetical protein